MNPAALKMGHMAGRGISCREIGHQFGSPETYIRQLLRSAGIVPNEENGPTIHIILPISSFVPEIDAVGQRRRMARDEVARAVLRGVFAGGEILIEDMIERGGSA